jgi:RNA polymerase sigma factor (sigma-70 family)
MSETKFFRDLFLHNRKDLLSFLTRRVGRADADDLLQETFARFIVYSDARAVSEPPPFLQKIAMNLVRDFARSRAVEARYVEFGELPEDAPSSERSPLAQVEAMEKWRLVAAAIAALPPRCREVFVLYMHDDLTIAEISARLGMSQNMAQKHMRMALVRCWAALE